MNTNQWTVWTLVLALCGVLVMSGCGGGGSDPVPLTSGQAVGGNWTLSRTQSTSSDPYCGTAGAVVSESWTITQAPGSGNFSLATQIQGGGSANHSGVVDNAGKFTVREERILSVASRCFIAAVGTYTGDFNTGTGNYSLTISSDPSNTCQPLNVPASCTATHTFTVRR